MDDPDVHEGHTDVAFLRRVVANDVRAALDGDEPDMVFQPIVDLLDRRVIGVEALARFRSRPHRTTDVWFAAAHEAGLGVELEHRAVTRAVAAAGLLPPEVHMAINVSPSAVLASGFEALLAAGPAERLVLEITEHARIRSYDELLRALEPVRALGVRVAVDDVGAGYATLRHVLSLDPEIIKLDREITLGVEVNAGRAKLVGGLIAGASAVSTLVVAEGIESEGQLLRLLELGARGGQGYFIGRPTDLESALSINPDVFARTPDPAVSAASTSMPRQHLADALILVVDDAPGHRLLVRSTFELEGATVHEAATVAAALAALRATEPDIVLLDMRLPDGTGMDVLDDLRRAASPPAVLFVTAAGAVADRVEALDRGAADYVLKPFSPQELVARVDAVLRRRR